MYERQRTAWGFSGGGPGSGLFQSTDGGKTWKQVTGNGLPRGTLGRIALDICKTNPNVIYAQIEAAPDKETGADLDVPAGRGGAAGAARGGAAGAAGGGAAAAGGQAGGGGRGGGGGGGGGRGGGQAQPPDPQSNGIWRSMDKGKTWTFMSNQNQRPMYFSQIRVDPNMPDVVYVGGVNPQKSTDGGKNFLPLNGMGHVDNHAIWIDALSGTPATARTPGKESQHVFYGNDGGMDISYDAGRRWESIRLQGAALSYHVSADMRRPYWVCTGLQDNGTWCGPSSTRTGGIHMWNWISVGGGDGFQTQIDPTDPNIFYTESQNAGINRYDLNTGQTQNIKPAYQAGLPPVAPGGGGAAGAGGAGAPGGGGGGGGRGGGGGGRGNVINTPEPNSINQFNWNTPIRLSPHNSSTVIIGGRQLFISRDRGQTWTISKSLGKNIDLNQRSILEQSYSLPGCGRGSRGTPCILSRHDGYVANEYGTITEIAESSKLPGVIWVGTDDGNLQLSKDGGLTFTEVGARIPVANHEYYISGIEASWYDAATAYVSLDAHRHDDMKPYIFKTTDYGQTWKAIQSNLPAFGWVNSIRQDPVNRNLLYAPTEYGFYISLDDGGSWKPFMPNLPTFRVDEVLVHPRDNDLILATHSRGIWIMDDISALQNLGNVQNDATLFEPRDAILWRADRKNQTEVPGDKWWEGEVAPRGTAIAYYLKNAASGEVKVTITNTATGNAVRTCIGTGTAGMNRFQWTLQGDGGGGGGQGGGGGRGGRGGQPDPNVSQAPQGPQPCSGGGGGGGGRGGGGGGGGFGGGGGGIGAGVYRVTLAIAGREVGSQTFRLLEDIWLNEK